MNSRHIAALCLAVLLPSCTGWAPPRPDPPSPERTLVRVTTLTGEQVELRDPFITGEYYAGWLDRERQWRAPLDSIQSFEISETHLGRTQLLLIGVGLVVLGVAVASGTCFDLWGCR